jgi:geranylgeranyl transferase type-1 subunit beta
MLDKLSLIDASGNRLYLLEKTQHIIGGFGKGLGEPPGKASDLVHSVTPNFLFYPDLLHSYLGLVSLALLNEPGLISADPTLCTGTRIIDRVKSLPWWREHTQAEAHGRASGGKTDYLMVSGG